MTAEEGYGRMAEHPKGACATCVYGFPVAIGYPCGNTGEVTPDAIAECGAYKRRCGAGVAEDDWRRGTQAGGNRENMRRMRRLRRRRHHGGPWRRMRILPCEANRRGEADMGIECPDCRERADRIGKGDVSVCEKGKPPMREARYHCRHCGPTAIFPKKCEQKEVDHDR